MGGQTVPAKACPGFENAGAVVRDSLVVGITAPSRPKSLVAPISTIGRQTRLDDAENDFAISGASRGVKFRGASRDDKQEAERRGRRPEFK